MLSIPGYRITEEIHRGAGSLVYRGYRESDQLPLIFKTTNAEYAELKDLARLQHEYSLTKDWQELGVIRSHALLSIENTQVLVLHDIGGTDIKYLLAAEPLSVESFLTLALAFATSLGRIHQHQIIHKDINPANLVVNPLKNQTQIIDFGISSQLSREIRELQSPSHLEGTLAYLSPEQTGRMNRALDYRTDFYSLGASFHEMLTGEPPFTTTDPMELVHCHLAKMPIPVHQLRLGVPPILSDLIHKLMAKNAEDRYQSALGLIADLEICRNAFLVNHNIAPFPLGRQDVTERFQIPQKLYGRTVQVQQVLDAFARACQGETELLLVAGYSGVGKTALVHEIHKPVTVKNGYFIEGKFDQFQRNIPYTSLIEAFQELMRQLLTESQAQIAQWKALLEHTLGSNAQIIVEVIPDLALILGPQAPIQALPPQEARNRFQATFSQFISVFASAQHPLVIFLDDLQWADSASLSFLEELLENSRQLCLLILGAYRDNEVHPMHPFMLCMESLRKTETRISTLHLEPLCFADIAQLVCETLTPTQEDTTPLAQLIASKTGGNPFFVNAFLNALHSNGWLLFNTITGHWQWEVAHMQAQNITDNVVELMRQKLLALAPASQELLVRAACIGHQFDLATLAMIVEHNPGRTMRDLWHAIQAGLVQQQGTFQIEELFVESGMIAKLASYRFRFVHDQVQQAAYELLPANKTAEMHLKIGRLWLRQRDVKQTEEFLFAVVNQFQPALDLLQDPNERTKLAHLHLQAGKKAIASTAFASALRYFENGLILLQGGDWEQQYELTLALSLERAECEYLNHQAETAIEHFKICLQYAKTKVEKAMIHLKQVDLYGDDHQHAIAEGLAGLRCLAIRVSPHPSRFHIALELLTERWQRRGRQIKPLLDQLPMTENPEQQLAIRLFASITPFAYWNNPQLGAMTLIKGMNLVYRHGITSDAAYILMCFCTIKIGLKKYAQAWPFAEKALDIAQHQSPDKRVMSLFVYANFINHWYRPLHSGIAHFEQNLLLALESGNWIYATMCMSNHTHVLYATGIELSVFKGQCETFRYRIKQMNDPLKGLALFDFMITFIQALNTVTPPEQAQINLSKIANEYTSGTSNSSVRYLIHLFCAWKALLFENFEEADQHLKKAKKDLSGSLGTQVFTDFPYLDVLITLGRQSTPASPSVALTQPKRLQAQMQKLAAWAKQCPQNFEYKYLLAAAETARVAGHYEEAGNMYDRAIGSAQKNAFIHQQALACEYAARFYLQREKGEFAQIYLKKSRYLYGKWGAHTKVQFMETHFAKLLGQTHGVPANSGTSTSTSTTATESLDLGSVMKASQVISGEIVLAHLLEKLMHIMIQNAGAEQGFLLLETAEGWRIEAEGNVSREIQQPAVQVFQSHPLNPSPSIGGIDQPNFPLSLIQYVALTKKPLVLDNASARGRFTMDPCIREVQAKSVLCLPILHQGKLAAILYLENRLMEAAFTEDRLELLAILSSQAAISIQNARVYENLETTVTQRTADLQASKHSLESTLENLHTTQAKLIQAEKMASLGQLVANVAHEINSPMSAVKSGGLTIATCIEEVLADLPMLFEVLPPKARHLFNQLLLQTPKTILNSREERLQKNRIAQQLQEAGVTEADRKARILVKLGAPATPLDYLSLLNHPESDFILNIANNVATLIHSTSTINTAVDRVSKIVTSLKAFSEPESSGEMRQINVKEGIESVLLLYQNDIDKGSKLVRLYETSLPVLCYPDELKQVWTHLVHNALQAMNYKGTLTVAITAAIDSNPQETRVSISDTGSGIAEAVRARIFEPFFTTRPYGEGAGLGLGIAQKIIDRHQGRIEIQTELGTGSTFTVILPCAVQD